MTTIASRLVFSVSLLQTCPSCDHDCIDRNPSTLDKNTRPPDTRHKALDDSAALVVSRKMRDNRHKTTSPIVRPSFLIFGSHSSQLVVETNELHMTCIPSSFNEDSEIPPVFLPMFTPEVSPFHLSEFLFKLSMACLRAMSLFTAHLFRGEYCRMRPCFLGFAPLGV